MKRLTILSNASGYGGSEKSIELLLPILAKRYQVDVFVENEEHFYMLFQLKHDDRINIIKFRGGKNLLDIVIDLLVLIKHLTINCPNYIWSNTNKGSFFLTLVPRFFLRKTGKILHYVRDFQWKYTGYIFGRAVKSGQLLIFPSNAYKEYYTKFISEYSARFVIPDPVKIVTNAKKITTGNYILAMGGISRLKGYDLLIKAYMLSEAKQSNISLRIYGNINDKMFYDELYKTIVENNLQDWIKIHSFTHSIDDVIEKALFVVNSTVPRFGGPEMLGRTILEAWVHEKPVIAFNSGGPKYIIYDEKDGLLVEPDNCLSLAKAFNRLITNEQERRAMGKAGRTKVTVQYSLEYIADQLCGLLEK